MNYCLIRLRSKDSYMVHTVVQVNKMPGDLFLYTGNHFDPV
jgi:hypothetical protein